MNKAFTKKAKMELDEKYHVISDGDNGVVLVFTEKRTRKTKNDKEEMFDFTEQWHFPRIVQALRKYSELAQSTCVTLESLLLKQVQIENLLEKIDKEFKQF